MTISDGQMWNMVDEIDALKAENAMLISELRQAEELFMRQRQELEEMTAQLRSLTTSGVAPQPISATA